MPIVQELANVRSTPTHPFEPWLGHASQLIVWHVEPGIDAGISPDGALEPHELAHPARLPSLSAMSSWYSPFPVQSGPLRLVVLEAPMSDPEDVAPVPTNPTTQALAELVARRKAALAQAAKGGPRGGARESERFAAARSASKSKPALRK
jgi:hypothetical protein